MWAPSPGPLLTIMLECAATSSRGVSLDQVDCAGVEHIEFQRKKKEKF